MDNIYRELVVQVAKRLRASGITWYLIGSTGLLLRNVNIGRDPKDIDFLIHARDAAIAKDLFHDFRPFCDERELGNGHGEQFRFRLAGRQIHFSAENCKGVYFKMLGRETISERILLNDLSVPDFPFEIEEKCYEAMGRPERAELIRDFRHLPI